MEEKEWYYVYILYSLKDIKLYIGFTTDLRKRVQDHNEGLNISTKGRRPLKLIYAESYRNECDAREREKFYKSGRGHEVLYKNLLHTFHEL